jgi:hypothetical protein
MHVKCGLGENRRAGKKWIEILNTEKNFIRYKVSAFDVTTAVIRK